MLLNLLVCFINSKTLQGGVVPFPSTLSFTRVNLLWRNVKDMRPWSCALYYYDTKETKLIMNLIPTRYKTRYLKPTAYPLLFPCINRHVWRSSDNFEQVVTRACFGVSPVTEKFVSVMCTDPRLLQTVIEALVGRPCVDSLCVCVCVWL